MASKKKAATAALLGEPVSVGGGAAAPKKKKVKKEDGVGGGGPSLEKRLVSLLNSNPKGLGQDEVCEGLGCSPSDLLNPINDLLNKVCTQHARTRRTGGCIHACVRLVCTVRCCR